MNVDRCLDTIVDFLEDHDRRLWPNSYVDIQEFIVHYVTLRDGIAWGSTSDPMTAEGITVGHGSQRAWGFSARLAFFAVDLLDFLRVTPLIDFPVTSAPATSGTTIGYFYRTLIPSMSGYLVLPRDETASSGDAGA
jgi:hypothetical protein